MYVVNETNIDFVYIDIFINQNLRQFRRLILVGQLCNVDCFRSHFVEHFQTSHQKCRSVVPCAKPNSFSPIWEKRNRQNLKKALKYFTQLSRDFLTSEKMFCFHLNKVSIRINKENNAYLVQNNLNNLFRNSNRKKYQKAFFQSKTSPLELILTRSVKLLCHVKVFQAEKNTNRQQITWFHLINSHLQRTADFFFV